MGKTFKDGAYSTKYGTKKPSKNTHRAKMTPYDRKTAKRYEYELINQ